MSSAAATPKRVTCRECGTLVDPHDAITIFELSVCGKCKPVFVQRLKESGLELDPQPASFGARAIAKGIDVVATCVFFSLLIGLFIGLPVGLYLGFNPEEEALVMKAMYSIFPIAAILFYVCVTAFELPHLGTTLGKSSMKLNVVAKDGHRLSLVQAFTRTLGELASVLLFGAGYVVALLTQNGEALHDFMARSRVVTL